MNAISSFFACLTEAVKGILSLLVCVAKFFNNLIIDFVFVSELRHIQRIHTGILMCSGGQGPLLPTFKFQKEGQMRENATKLIIINYFLVHYYVQICTLLCTDF